jgi:hypothetical protein
VHIACHPRCGPYIMHSTRSSLLATCVSRKLCVSMCSGDVCVECTNASLVPVQASVRHRIVEGDSNEHVMAVLVGVRSNVV